jgi:hypothetical protein
MELNGGYVCNIVKGRKIKQGILKIPTLSNGEKVWIHNSFREFRPFTMFSDIIGWGFEFSDLFLPTAD